MKTLKSKLIAIVVIISVGVYFYQNYSINKDLTNYLAQYTYLPATNNYQEAGELIYQNINKGKSAVLMIHGYSGCAEEYRVLAKELQKQDIPFYAPNLTGSGIGDLHLMSVAKPSDWLRDVVQAYDILKSMYENVNVVGHSNGANIAILLSELRPIDNLILTSPNFVAHPEDNIYKILMTSPVLSDITEFVKPTFRKPSRFKDFAVKSEVHSRETFAYPVMPTSSLATLWEIQDRVDLKKIKCKQLTVLFGKNDTVINLNQTMDMLKSSGLSFNKKVFENADHNLLESNEKDVVVDTIVNIIK